MPPDALSTFKVGPFFVTNQSNLISAKVNELLQKLYPAIQEVADIWEVQLLDRYEVSIIDQVSLRTYGTHYNKGYAGTIVQYRSNDLSSFTKALSHEIFEMIVNPSCTKAAYVQGSTFAVEICDPLVNVPFLYGQYVLANYVYPSFFNPNGLFPYDRTNVLQKPLDFSHGYGYKLIANRWRL